MELWFQQRRIMTFITARCWWFWTLTLTWVYKTPSPLLWWRVRGPCWTCHRILLIWRWRILTKYNSPALYTVLTCGTLSWLRALLWTGLNLCVYTWDGVRVWSVISQEMLRTWWISTSVFSTIRMILRWDSISKTLSMWCLTRCMMARFNKGLITW